MPRSKKSRARYRVPVIGSGSWATAIVKIILAVKGIVPETMQLISDYMQWQFKVPLDQLCIISGPSHAEEIAQEKFTFLTAASTNMELAGTVAKFFTTRYCRTSVSSDVMGAELAIVLKNIYALGAGIYSGLGYGDNFIAAYVANSVKEMKYFVSEVYPNENRQIGHGLSVRVSLLELRMVSEGYTACRCVHEINKKIGADIPIVETIYGILYENNNVSSEMQRIAEHFV